MVYGTATAASGSPRVQRKRAAQRERILDAAMELVDAGGIEALTVAALAAEVDLTPGALYRYFPGKDAVIAAMEGRALEAIAARFAAERAAAADRAAGLPARAAALHALLAAAETYLALPRHLPRDFRLVAALIGDPRPLVDDRAAAAVAPAFVRILAEVAAMFAAADRAGGLGDGDGLERTLIYWSALHGVLSIEKLRRFQPQAPTAAQMGRNAARALLTGWGAPADSLATAGALVMSNLEEPS